ncbi:MAG: PDZ domain-containing protein [Actinomycetota bacterium]|nr:PDZ domain-containing protein [Actinomycetota bacterium]
MRRLSWPGWLIVAGVVLLAVAAALFVAPSDQYIYLPDEARPLAPRVQVAGERRDRDGGGIHYVAVDVRKASLLEKLVPGLHEGATFEDVDDVLAEGEDERARRRTELSAMERSQEYAAAVALRALGYRIPARRLGVQVDGTLRGYPAAERLRRGDWIRAVDGRRVRRRADVTAALRRAEPGDVVRLGIERRSKRATVSLRAVEWPQLPGRAFVGMTIDDVFDVVALPVEVKIDLGQVGGPSAGLAFALDVLEELGRHVDRGYRIAATGELELDGTVRPVGGLKQKTIAARRSGMNVFLVPVHNAPEARRYAKTLRILPVESFQQALQKLATLPRSA